jgi:hypothetical protein
MVGSAAPYREPAENEEAKLDAEEIASFERAIAREQARQRRRVVVIVLACFAALGGIALVLSLRAKRTAAQRDALCRPVIVMHVENGVLLREDRIDCSPPAAHD